MKKLIITFSVFTLIFASCGETNNTITFDEGVVINGIRWATRNVDAPGTFAENPEDTGMFYRWNRFRGWNAISAENIDKGWTRRDPCPSGWRLPTREELESFRDAGQSTMTNNVNGKFFGTTPNQIFLPANGAFHGRGWVFIWCSSSGFDVWSIRRRTNASTVTFFPFCEDVKISIRCVAIE